MGSMRDREWQSQNHSVRDWSLPHSCAWEAVKGKTFLSFAKEHQCEQEAAQGSLSRCGVGFNSSWVKQASQNLD